MSQAYIATAVATLGAIAYGILAMKSHKSIVADELLSFAMWCGAAVAGVYMFVDAFRLSKEAVRETDGVYLGIFGVYLVFLSIQKLKEAFRRKSSPKHSARPVTQDSDKKEI